MIFQKKQGLLKQLILLKWSARSSGKARSSELLKWCKSTQAIMTILTKLETYFGWISLKLYFGNLRYQNSLGFCL